jgi:16S rRNA (adenine1518-N6/adenine1519-N6)-dimethyltransferase
MSSNNCDIVNQANPFMVERHTYSYLSQRFAQAGLRPLIRYGQNFLIDLNLLDLIVRTAEIEEKDIVLEVGTGTGSLTALLCQQAAWVISVEVDEGLFRLSGEELSGITNLTRINSDVLHNKHRFADEVLAGISAARSRFAGHRFKLVANLPYNVATPILSNLLLLDSPPTLMVVTIQKELAERITAREGTREYSALSIWIQSQCRASIVRNLPPSVFWPQPNVDSSILRIEHDQQLAGRINDLPFFHQTIRSLFLHRRKFLRKVVVQTMEDALDKPAIDAILARGNFNPTDRIDQLEVSRVIDLVSALRFPGPLIAGKLLDNG